MLDDTLKFFGLTHHAFTRPPREPYLDPARRHALLQLQRLVRRRGFAVVTGPPGNGKTVIVHYLCGSLNDNHHQVTYVPFSFLEKGHMLQYLSGCMGLEPTRGIAATLRAVQRHLHSIQPVNPVIVLDEVERLETHTAHLLRALLHDRADTAHHCTLIMAGTDSFAEQKLRLQVHEALRQRITLYVRLPALEPEHTAAYIAHHLDSAGSRNDLFEPPALQLIHELANGVPRLVSVLAEAAMDYAAGQQHQTVTLEHVRAAAEIVLPPEIAQVTA
jgi:type II secretory pathway predicted ATPase ExeA